MRWIHDGSMAAVILMLSVVGLTAGARVAVVETNSGQTFEGQLISEDDRVVTLLISEVQTPIRRSDIKTLTIKKSNDDIYAQRRAELADDDLDGRWKLAYDMYELGALKLARTETLALRQQFPDAEKVERLDAVIVDAIRLQEERERPATTPKTPTTPDAQPATPATPTGPAALREQQLTDEDINLLRLWELPVDLRELKPRVIIPRETIAELFKNYADQEVTPKGRKAQDDFYRLQGYEQIPLFFDLRARELYSQIRVIEDPPAMLKFRQEIYPTYITTYFARYFGGGQVDGLYLFGGKGDRVRTSYTDFFILQSYQNADARMIDRSRPTDSLLLQWGLPRQDAKFKAPDVPGWRPFFKGPDDEKYLQLAEWIGSLYRNPEYGITYTPPTHPAP